MKDNSSFLNPRKLFLIFYFLFLITGFFIYKDYGVSWDEPACRADLGQLNWNWMTKGDYKTLEEDDAKYHGPAFDIVLFSLEKFFNYNDMREVYFMRHLVTFLLFAIAVFCFYLISRRLFKSEWLALLGSVILVLSPRIFADAFYNTKDLAFTSLVIINIYTSLRFFAKKNYGNLIFHAFISALVVDIRIMGVIIPALTFLYLGIDFLKNRPDRKRTVIKALVFFIFLFGFIVLCWPVLWRKPVFHLIAAWQEMSKFPWYQSLFFQGQEIKATELPWYYIPVYILITTPVAYLLLFVSGLFFMARNAIRSRRLEFAHFLILYILFVPLAAVIVMHSVLYDGWRHLYFIYPSMILVALSGYEGIINAFRNNKAARSIVHISFCSFLVYMLITMIRLHPYQQVYFNFFAGKNLAEVKEKYEVDYWGLSYREGLERILALDSSQNISVYGAENDCIANNLNILKPEQRNRISHVEKVEMADYFLTDYRYYRKRPSSPVAFHIVRDNGPVFTAFKLNGRKFFTDLKLQLPDSQFQQVHWFNTFTEREGHWDDAKIIETNRSGPGDLAELCVPEIEYFGSLQIPITERMLTESGFSNYLTVKFDYKLPYDKTASFVLAVDSAGGGMYIWQGFDFSSLNNSMWSKHVVQLYLPKIKSINDRMIIYFWNKQKTEVTIDNIQVDLITLPEDILQKSREKLP